MLSDGCAAAGPELGPAQLAGNEWNLGANASSTVCRGAIVQSRIAQKRRSGDFGRFDGVAVDQVLVLIPACSSMVGATGCPGCLPDAVEFPGLWTDLEEMTSVGRVCEAGTRHWTPVGTRLDV